MKLLMVKLFTEYFAKPDNTYPGWCGHRTFIGVSKGRKAQIKQVMSEQANVLWYKENHDLWDFLIKHHLTNLHSLRPVSSKEQSQVKAHLFHWSLLWGRSAVNDTETDYSPRSSNSPTHLSSTAAGHTMDHTQTA